MVRIKKRKRECSERACSVYSYSAGGSFHFSIRSLSSPSLKVTLTSTEDAPLKGNMLSSAKSFGK